MSCMFVKMPRVRKASKAIKVDMACFFWFFHNTQICQNIRTGLSFARIVWYTKPSNQKKCTRSSIQDQVATVSGVNTSNLTQN